MDAIIIIVGLGAALIVGGIFIALSLPSRGHGLSTQEIAGTNFTPSQMFMGKDNLGGVAINERTYQICLFPSPSSPPRVLPLTDILGVYLINNGEILGERKRRYPDKVVNFLDEVQDPKEGLTQSVHIDSSHGPNQRIDLVIVVHDQEEPLHMVNFLDMETKEGGILFETAIATAKHWYNVLDGLIFQADQLVRLESEAPKEKEMAEVRP